MMLAETNDAGEVVSTLTYGATDDGIFVALVETTPEYRRQGCATRLIRRLEALYPGERFYGYVTQENLASLTMVRAMGADVRDVEGQRGRRLRMMVAEKRG